MPSFGTFPAGVQDDSDPNGLAFVLDANDGDDNIEGFRMEVLWMGPDGWDGFNTPCGPDYGFRLIDPRPPLPPGVSGVQTPRFQPIPRDLFAVVVAQQRGYDTATEADDAARKVAGILARRKQS